MFNIHTPSSTRFTALTDDQIRRQAPSVFAEDKHESRSDRYTYIPTIQLVEAMRNEGFLPVKASQSRCKDQSRKEFTKHLIRFRRSEAPLIVGDSVPEIVLINSHDGTSSYQLIAGIFRLVCSNGLIVKSADFGEIRVPHRGNVVDQVLSGSWDLTRQLPDVEGKVESLRSTALEYQEQQIFAKAALQLKWEEEEAPVTPEQVLRARRIVDENNDAFTTMNRVQENLIRGGLRGTYAGGRKQRTREVKSVNENVRLNTALWTLAEEMRKLKAA